MFDDISFLVQETLKESHKNPNGRNVFDSFFKKKAKIDAHVCGVLYQIQQNASTFVVRTHVCENLAQEHASVLKHPNLYPGLRFSDEDDIEEKLGFFECDDIGIAKSIKEKFGNKRFPIFEEHVFNISDPGDCWWAKLEEDTISIFFKLSHTQNMDELVKLGPLGDSVDTMEYLSKLGGYFQMLFPVSDFSSGFGQFSILTEDPRNLIYRQFKDILADGETSYNFWKFLRELEVEHQDKDYIDRLQAANHFMMELSQLRTFWISVQNDIS